MPQRPGGDSPHRFLVTPINVAFDADRSRITALLPFAFGASTTDIHEDGAIIEVARQVSSRSWKAKNAFGVEVLVQETKTKFFGVSARPFAAEEFGKRIDGGNYRGEYHRFLSLTVPAAAADAKRLITDGSIRFVVRASSSTKTKRRTFSGDYTWKATITDPKQKVDETYATYVDLDNVRIWLADLNSRKILVKTTLRRMLGYK